MSKFRWLLTVAVAVILSPALGRAQQGGTVTGTVVDAASQQPLAGVQVFVVGTSRGALSNQEGRFVITAVPAGDYQVRATMIGYSQGTHQVAVQDGQTASVDFAISVSAIGLDELVVTATGQQQRKRETGNAVSTVNMAQVDLAPVTSAAQLLQGRVAGASILQSAGATGSGSTIRIRGANSISLSNAPLLIVDGVRVESSESSLGFGVGGQAPSKLNDLSTEDIESIEVLKGPAAAALYGTAAANGVIQVTTKRGRAGQADFKVWTEYGALRRTGAFPDNVVAMGNLVNAKDSTWVGRCDNMRLAIGANPTGNQVGCTGVTDTYRFNPLENPETTPFRNGSRQTVGGSVSGGSDGMTYYISSSWEDETGVMPNNQLGRIRVQANTSGRVGDKLTVGSNISYLNSKLQISQSDNALYGITGLGLYGSPLPDNVEEFQGYQDDPQYFYDWKTYQNYGRLQASLRGDYRPLSWLVLNGTAGLDRYGREDRNRIPRTSAYSGRGGVYAHGFIQNYSYDIWDVTTNASATAMFELRPDLTSTTAVGTQYLRENLHRIYAFGANLTPGVEESLAGATADYEAGENNTLNATISAYVQQQFAWRDRVFVNAALRGDQNTAFGANAGWIWYPSVSGSWVISEESFFPQLHALSNLRLRGAYGQSGLRPGPTDAVQAFGVQIATRDNSDAPGITFGSIGNNDLRAERISEWELGFESGFFSGRFGLEATYYNKTSRDALVSKPLPPSLGSSGSRYENLGRVDNHGFELGLNGQPVHTADLRWNVNLTGSLMRNKLVTMGLDATGNPMPDIPLGLGSKQRHKEGYALGSYFDFPIVGYADKNGDGLLGPDEITVWSDTVVYLGSSIPTRELSFNTDVSIRDVVKIGALLDYKGGHKLLNATRAWRCSTNRDANCDALYNPTTPLDEQAASLAQTYYNAYTGFIEDADFLKLREVSLTFALPRHLAGQFGAKGLSLTLAGRNLMTWTGYTGLDPEVNYAGQANFTRADFSTLPPNRYYTVRVNANF